MLVFVVLLGPYSICQAILMQTSLCSSSPCAMQTSLCQTILMQTPLCSSSSCPEMVYTRDMSSRKEFPRGNVQNISIGKKCLTSQIFYQDIDLASEVKYLLYHSFTSAIRRIYNSARAFYESLCRNHDYILFPASIKTIMH